MKSLLLIITVLFASLTLVSCNYRYQYHENKINITTTTNIIADLATRIGQDKVNVYSLMGSGVDPHQYVARPQDYLALSEADLVLVSGLHLEGKMVDVIEAFGNQKDKHVLVLGDMILKQSSKDLTSLLIPSANFGANYDPHFWFDIELYTEIGKFVLDKLIELDLDNKTFYQTNYLEYKEELVLLNEFVLNEVNKIPTNMRILITAHDAFEYFGKKYGFNVYSLQGLSTEDEVSPSDIKEVIDIIIDKNIRAIFPETSVPVETISSVKEATKAKGIDLIIGNDLYSDSLGDKKDDDTYIKMYKKNVLNIVETIMKEGK